MFLLPHTYNQIGGGLFGQTRRRSKTSQASKRGVAAMPPLLTLSQRPDMDPNGKKREERSRPLRYCLRSSQAPNSKGLSFEEMTQWSLSLERLLSSKYGIKVFQAFLKSEFSDENIEFWLVCEDYKKIRSSFRMPSRARKIFKRYIQADAAREINIDHKTRDLIRRNVTAPTRVCFDDAQRIVYNLMEKDSYPRFLRSDIYRGLLDSTSKSVMRKD